jgi:hypothetical protein
MKEKERERERERLIEIIFNGEILLPQSKYLKVQMYIILIQKFFREYSFSI